MNTPDLRETLRVARTIAEKAAALALEGYRTDVEVHKKGAVDLLTEYDLRCEKLIRDRLGRHFPSHAIVGEEQEATGTGELVWYVDPIDGTTNYAHGHPFFCVSMALYRGPEALVGVVSAPALGVTWAGARGLGVLRNGEPIRVSNRDVLGDALCSTGFAYDRRTADADNLDEFRAVLQNTRGIRRCGSAALDLALVADGTYDVYWERGLNPWDMCAGALLVLEAGGRVSDLEGGPGDPRTGSVVATNGAVHDAVVKLLRNA